MKKKHYIVFVLFLLVVLPSDAQCAMCRAVLESEADVSQAKGINNGIVYLMAIPYILVGITIFYIYKLLNKKEAVKKS
ncbi:hypothetical protein C8N46_101437 [Kordia periserrulae]|uniref:Uncharacterized protein n=1 Tax=Kordia periserrulae TaxID=701523 RepID=A0A2T6C687_9FLAO|nr:hypothetical protein [Kordia periserrulae]PTX63829.1 hypothetical protein C8N46_101437 [Kordia periserrulae]